jgi:hypothetical protein
MVNKKEQQMNQRIKELAEQNGFIHNWQPPGEQNDRLKTLEKFAELIVQECAERLLNDAKLTDIQTTRCVASIKEHFGVE